MMNSRTVSLFSCLALILSIASSLYAAERQLATLQPTSPTWEDLKKQLPPCTPMVRGESLNNGGGGYINDFFAREFWRFVMVQQYVAKLAMTAVDYPPMQDPASFNLDEMKKKVEAAMKQREGQ